MQSDLGDLDADDLDDLDDRLQELCFERDGLADYIRQVERLIELRHSPCPKDDIHAHMHSWLPTLHLDEARLGQMTANIDELRDRRAALCRQASVE
jgi:hypothetical protein